MISLCSYIGINILYNILLECVIYMIRILKLLSIVSSLGMLFILLGGALVTKTDSGAGCGESWPLCHGELIPSNITPELVIELSHRLVSSVMGITIVLLAVIAWKVIGHI